MSLFVSNFINYRWDLNANFTGNIPLDKEKFIKFWKSGSLNSWFGLDPPWQRSVDMCIVVCTRKMFHCVWCSRHHRSWWMNLTTVVLLTNSKRQHWWQICVRVLIPTWNLMCPLHVGSRPKSPSNTFLLTHLAHIYSSVIASQIYKILWHTWKLYNYTHC